MQASAGSLAQGREVTEIPAVLVDQMFDIFEDLLIENVALTEALEVLSPELRSQVTASVQHALSGEGRREAAADVLSPERRQSLLAALRQIHAELQARRQRAGS